MCIKSTLQAYYFILGAKYVPNLRITFLNDEYKGYKSFIKLSQKCKRWKCTFFKGIVSGFFSVLSFRIVLLITEECNPGFGTICPKERIYNFISVQSLLNAQKTI